MARRFKWGLILGGIMCIGNLIAIIYLSDPLRPLELSLPVQDNIFFQEAYQKHLSYEKQLKKAKAAIEHHNCPELQGVEWLFCVY